MLPAMTPAERTSMFLGLKNGAPEAVFTVALRLAERVLDAPVWRKLERSLGEASRVPDSGVDGAGRSHRLGSSSMRA
jgi:hypothetical protein